MIFSKTSLAPIKSDIQLAMVMAEQYKEGHVAGTGATLLLLISIVQGQLNYNVPTK